MVDPARLIRNGFPENEYDPEVNDMCSRIASGATVSRDLVESVLVFWCSRADPADVDKIVQLLSQD
jgi:hypothetical protein